MMTPVLRPLAEADPQLGRSGIPLPQPGPKGPLCREAPVSDGVNPGGSIFVYHSQHMLNLKFALRTLFKTPFVTLVAILSLALGIGANAAIFSLFNQLLLRPLPVPAPDRLVNLA